MTITDGERRVIECFMDDDFVADRGWRSPDASTYVDPSDAKTCGMTGLQYAGTMSSLIQKGLCWSNGNTWGLTDAGRSAAAALERERRETTNETHERPEARLAVKPAALRLTKGRRHA